LKGDEGMKYRFFISLIIFSLIFLSGFTSSDQIVINQLSEKITKLESDVAELREQNGQLLVDIVDLKFSMNKYQKIYLGVDSINKGYNRVDTTEGMFFVVYTNALKINNGYKLSFSVGNPQFCTYKDAVIRITHGEKIKEDQSYSDWRKTLKTKEIKITQDLLPGTWNNVDITVTPSGNNEVDYFEFELITNTVSFDRNSTLYNIPTDYSLDNVIESKIDGDFNGFENDMIFILQNGQIWKQTSFDIKVAYKYCPDVVIYKSGTKYKMFIPGIDKIVTVERIK
jgi:hypothetical protein